MKSVGSGLVSIERDGRRGEVYLTRPRKANAMTIDLMKDMVEAFRRLDADDEIWAITILGQGDVFSAGIDLDLMRSRTDPNASVELEVFSRVLGVIENTRQPVVAGIKGAALAGAFELTLACDLRVIGREAKYGLIETQLGTFPHGGGTQRLPRLIGLSKAKELVLTGKTIDPEEAYRIGLVHEIADDEEVDEHARSLADDLCENAPLALRHGKRALNASFEMPLEQGLEYERTLGLQLDSTHDYREGFEARIEGREPEFRGE